MTVDRDLHLQRLRQMVRIRRFEERCVELYSAATIRGFVHLYIGEEAVAVGVMESLTPEDAVVATYREHGHALARGVPAAAVMAEMYGKVEGTSRGRGGSMHIFDASHRFYGGNAVVAGGLPVAAGLALADHLQGRERVTACFFGEGAMAEGEFHETMNLAALWRLPVLFCCENNLYAMGTALDRSEAQTDLALKAASYGMPAWAVDGMDVAAVADAAHKACTEIRGGGGPVFLELRTYRFRAHSMYDPERYRDKAEVDAWRQRDPIDLWIAHLTDASDGAPAEERPGAACVAGERDMTQLPELAKIEAEVAAEIDDAVAFAEAGTFEPVEDLTRFVYSEDRP
jgi:pyruvate dehydrogenase E1 component alpha subunit